MKTLHFLATQLFLGIALFSAGIAMSFTTADDVKADTIYTFNSTDLSEGSFAKTANWMVVSSAPGCSTSGNRPCNIAVPAGSSLASEIAGLNNSEVLAINPTERKP